MAKTILYKTLSSTLALLVLFSTVSFTVQKHFCGEHLVDVAVFTQAKTCHAEAVNTAIKTSVKKKKCCKNVIDVFEGQDELKSSSFEDLNFNKQQITIVASCFYSYIFKSLAKKNIYSKNYSPPNLISNIQILDQVFII